VAVTPGLTEAPHAGAGPGFVITTSVTTRCWPAGTVKTLAAGAPASTTRVSEMI
jgi:hypothetical protein